MGTKVVSQLTKIEQEMPKEVWNKIAATAPDSALKSWASREAYFNQQYQAYLSKQPKPGAAPASPIQTTPVRSAYPPQPISGGGAQTSPRMISSVGVPPGGKPTKVKNEGKKKAKKPSKGLLK